MSHGIDEAIVLLVSADFTNEEGRIQNDAGDGQGQQANPKKEQDTVAPVEQHPADIEYENDRNQASA